MAFILMCEISLRFKNKSHQDVTEKQGLFAYQSFVVDSFQIKELSSTIIKIMKFTITVQDCPVIFYQQKRALDQDLSQALD